ncbi:hypothetical protein HK098_001536 [Nowakowskiella sp. JEL0407]|nr:hypothetical protein HK098_001536 [Nowakowskiella sp. JEL0407]
MKQVGTTSVISVNYQSLIRIELINETIARIAADFEGFKSAWQKEMQLVENFCDVSVQRICDKLSELSDEVVTLTSRQGSTRNVYKTREFLQYLKKLRLEFISEIVEEMGVNRPVDSDCRLEMVGKIEDTYRKYRERVELQKKDLIKSNSRKKFTKRTIDKLIFLDKELFINFVFIQKSTSELESVLNQAELIASRNDELFTGFRTELQQLREKFIEYLKLAHKVVDQMITTPQLEDYSCPICLDITFKPVVLSHCNHRFCRRCLAEYEEISNLAVFVFSAMSYMHTCPLCRGAYTSGTKHIDRFHSSTEHLFNREETRRNSYDSTRSSAELRRYGSIQINGHQNVETIRTGEKFGRRIEDAGTDKFLQRNFPVEYGAKRWEESKLEIEKRCVEFMVEVGEKAMEVKEDLIEVKKTAKRFFIRIKRRSCF